MACQILTLKRLPLESAVRKALTELPETLDETYERILTSIPPESEQYVWRALALLLVVSTTDVKNLLSFVSKGESDDQDDDPEEELDLEAFRDMASCLVTVTKITDELTTVRLAHYTIKEYLVAPRCGHGPASAFHFSSHQAGSYFIRVLVRKLRSWHPKMQSDIFTKYSMDHWRSHLREADTLIASDPELSSLMFTSFDPQSSGYINLATESPAPDGIPARRELAILLRLIGLNLYATTTTFLLQLNPEQIVAMCELEHESWHNIPLLGALARQHDDRYCLLLAERCGRFPTKCAPLVLWVMEKYVDVRKVDNTLRTLIIAKAPLSPEGVRILPLQVVVRRMQVPYVKMLLEHGADPNAVGCADGQVTQGLRSLDGGGESPLFTIRRLMDWREKGIISTASCPAAPAKAIEQLLVDAGGREFCAWT